MAGITPDLATWVAGLSFDAIPPDVVDRVKLIVADSVGIMVRARNDSESTPPLIAALADLGLSNGRFHVIGSPETWSALGAVRINATDAHSIELDDSIELRAKFDSLVRPLLGAERGGQLFETVIRLDQASSLDRLWEYATPRAAVGAS